MLLCLIRVVNFTLHEVVLFLILCIKTDGFLLSLVLISGVATAGAHVKISVKNTFCNICVGVDLYYALFHCLSQHRHFFSGYLFSVKQVNLQSELCNLNLV